MSLTKPMYSKPAYVKVPTKTQMKKDLAALKRNIRAGLKGPDADLYRMMAKALDIIEN